MNEFIPPMTSMSLPFCTLVKNLRRSGISKPIVSFGTITFTRSASKSNSGYPIIKVSAAINTRFFFFSFLSFFPFFFFFLPEDDELLELLELLLEDDELLLDRFFVFFSFFSFCLLVVVTTVFVCTY